MLDIFLFLLTRKGVSLADAVFNDEGLDPAPLPQGMGIARHRLAKMGCRALESLLLQLCTWSLSAFRTINRRRSDLLYVIS
jgi:hypothetical protein